MKKILLFAFTVPLFLHAQISLNQWSPIKAVSDSSHHNRNAYLKGNYPELMLFWDQQIDATTTRLCYKLLEDPLAETKVLIEQVGVHLRYPKVATLSMGDPMSDYIVFYETNEGGNTDLNYIICKPDGTQSIPHILSDLEGNDINLTLDNSSLKVTWENTNKLYACEYLPLTNNFNQPVCIEQNGGYSPTFSFDEISYLQSANDSTCMISKRMFFSQGNVVITDSSETTFAGQCSGLNSCSPYWGINKCMQQDITGEKSGIIVFDEWMGSSSIQSELYNLTDPVVSDYMIGVKGYMYFISYVTDELTQHEIVAGINQFGANDVHNISQWPGDDKNPSFFVSFPASYLIRVHLLWESDRQGYSTIYTSYYDYLFGGTDELVKTEILRVNPCPFEQEVTIEFQSTEKTGIRIIDLQGIEIKTLTTTKKESGVQQAVWDGTNHQGKKVPAGSYLVVAGSGNLIKSKIIIKK